MPKRGNQKSFIGDAMRQAGGARSLPKNAPIAIVGAGFAGLAAASRLISLGYNDVTIFEATNRTGGRVYPIAFADGYIQLGAEYINGRKNPIYEIARNLNVLEADNDEEEDDDPLENGILAAGDCTVSQNDRNAFTEFASPLMDKYESMAGQGDQTRSIGQLYSQDYQRFLSNQRATDKKSVYDALTRLYRSSYEAEWSADWNDLSLLNYDQFDTGDSESEEHSMNKMGYKAVLDFISTNVSRDKIKLNSRVTNIDYSGNEVKIRLESGLQPKTFQAVIVTASLGHLKKFARSLFTPQLSRTKLTAIDTLGFGSIGKLFLVYNQPWWSQNTETINILPVDGCTTNSPATDKLFTTFHPMAWNNNVLQGWLSGSAPAAIDAMSDDQVKTAVTGVFRRMLRNNTIPEPTRILRNKWTTDPLFGGTYSYISVAAAKNGASFDQIATPIVVNGQAKVLFAGEATHPDVYQTTIGAYISGRREADRLFLGNW
uniref:Amine oxidase domain-containing protein n=1 Tax=Plectus sambesii TaxID=2011161 RepID=A0A914WYU0_9BILA